MNLRRIIEELTALEQLRSYPRMRDLVFGYLTVQERISRYEDIMADLDEAGEKPDRPFWARLSAKLEGLRADCGAC